MSGYNKETGVFELTATKAEFWFRRQDIPDELVEKYRGSGGWPLIKAVLAWQGLEIIKDGGNYVRVKATPEQLWQALSGQPSDPDRARHYYR
jgi:hypothetical protein